MNPVKFSLTTESHIPVQFLLQHNAVKLNLPDVAECINGPAELGVDFFQLDHSPQFNQKPSGMG